MMITLRFLGHFNKKISQRESWRSQIICLPLPPMLKFLYMFKRAYSLIIDPTKTWQIIAQEQVDIRRLIQSYALPMTLIPVASTIIRVLFARGPFITLYFIFNLLIGGVVNYILLIAALLFAGWLVSIFAQYFASKTELIAAMKLVVYSTTPVWLCSIFKIFPALSVLALLGFYSIYLVFAGLPIILQTPPDKNVAFASSIVAIGVIILTYLSIIAGGLFYL